MYSPQPILFTPLDQQPGLISLAEAQRRGNIIYRPLRLLHPFFPSSQNQTPSQTQNKPENQNEKKRTHRLSVKLIPVGLAAKRNDIRFRGVGVQAQVTPEARSGRAFSYT
ncbi:hypothetical protein EIP91_010950, partial [Steccherinum ochraceum]